MNLPCEINRDLLMTSINDHNQYRQAVVVINKFLFIMCVWQAVIYDNHPFDDKCWWLYPLIKITTNYSLTNQSTRIVIIVRRVDAYHVGDPLVLTWMSINNDLVDLAALFLISFLRWGDWSTAGRSSRVQLPMCFLDTLQIPLELEPLEELLNSFTFPCGAWRVISI